MKTTQLDKEVKALQKRLEKYGKYEGMFLNTKYTNLMSEIENVRNRIKENDTDLTPQRVSGLIKRIKNIQKSEVPKYFSIYIPETDTIYSLENAPELNLKIGETPSIDKPIETVEKLKEKYAPTNADKFEPETTQSEVYFSDEVLQRILKSLYKYHWGLMAELKSQIHSLINDLGYETVAKAFEENAKEYGVSGDMGYNESKALFEEMGMWDFMDLDTNKSVTESMDYYETEV